MSKIQKNKRVTYAFIDASNLFYGGKKDLGWQIDYKRLFEYLQKKYNVSKTFYYGGVEIYDFEYSVLDFKDINLAELLPFLENKLKTDKNLTEAELLALPWHIKQIKFYIKLEDIGFELKLKPVKTYYDVKGNASTKKANCDVDMTFDLMRLIAEYSAVVILSGDGDFVPVLSHLKHKKRAITILAREERTSKEMKGLVNDDFKNFTRLKKDLVVQKNIIKKQVKQAVVSKNTIEKLKKRPVKKENLALKLVRPNIRFKQSFLEAVKEFHKENRNKNIKEVQSVKEFSEFIKKLKLKEKQVNLEKWQVPESTYWFVDNKKFIGRVSIRHKLNKKLKEYGGHIGFEIRSSQRENDYGKIILELALRKALKLNIKNVLLTCEEENILAKKMIISNGGILIDKLKKPNKKTILRYQIKLYAK